MVGLPVLLSQTTLTVVSASYLSLLCVLLPVLAVAQMKGPIPDIRAARISVYASSGVFLVLLGVVSVAGLDGAFLSGTGIGGVGWLPPSGSGGALLTVGWVLTITLLGVLTLWGFTHVRRRIGVAETAIVRDLLPATARERWAFAGLSACAGFGEEAAYRGFAVPALTTVTGTPVAALVLSSVAFGVLHAYQGWFGIVRTAVMGAVLGIGFLASGSLLAPMVAHFAIDLAAGLVLRDRLIG